MKRGTAHVRRIWMLTLLGGLVWLGAAVAAPWMRSAGIRAGELIYSAFRPICHQIESRCFTLWGEPAAVCTRCLGIYAGFAAGALAYPFRNGFRNSGPPSKFVFLALSLPIGADFIGNLFGWWQTSGMGRFGLGFLWGLVLPAYLISGLSQINAADIRSAVFRNRTHSSSNTISKPSTASNRRMKENTGDDEDFTCIPKRETPKIKHIRLKRSSNEPK